MHCTCPLLGVKHTSLFALHMSAYHPTADIWAAKISNALLRYTIGPRSNGAEATAQSNWQKQALERTTRTWESADMSIIWTIIIGFIAGIVAKFLHPGSSNEPSGFILTVALGIAGSFAATYLGQALGWYRAGEGAGFIGAVVGAIILLVVWGFFSSETTKEHIGGNEQI